MEIRKKTSSPNRLVWAAVACGLAAALVARAQEFRTLQGDSSRAGLPTVSPSTPGGTTPDVYNDVGRAFLRWWDPTLASRQQIDTDENSADGIGIGNPVASWVAPSPGSAGRASGSVIEDPTTAEYRFATTVAQTANTADPRTGATGIYTWTFANVIAGQDYQVYVNLPIGPTDVDPGPGITQVFPQRYFVLAVSGATGGDDIEIIDLFSFGGGEVRLGDGGNQTDKVYQPTGNTLTVTLYNTTPRTPAGDFIDGSAQPGNELVYADAARIVSLSGVGAGKVVATPVVGELTQTPPIGGAPQYVRRVFTSRNEDTFVGDLGKSFEFGAVTSLTYDSQDVADPTLTGRRNMVWSWPATRPFNQSTAESQRYAREKRDFVLGPVLANPAIRRAEQRIQVDDLNGSAAVAGTFLPQVATADNIGETFQTAVAVAGAPTANVSFAPNLPAASYSVQVWLPATGGAGLANGVSVEIYQGPTLTATLALDQGSGQRWVTIPFQPALGYAHSELLPLRVAITDATTTAGEAGKPVYADAVRFVRKADLSVRSTPVFASTAITGQGNKDVLVVALENGRLYCLDAHGDPGTATTGVVPNALWTYPTEDPAGDPNRTPAFDGKDGMAEEPTGFDLSSAFVANIGGEDLLYVAAKNGKVYCLEMDGRGDGTTTRRWTYPDDFDPTTPTLPMQPGLRPIQGSLAFGTTTGGQDLVLVPTAEGRLIALDAAGNPATRRTAIVWQYPLGANAPLGPLQSAPTVAFGNVYFTSTVDQVSTQGAVTAVNLDTGLPVWTTTTTSLGAFQRFRAGVLAIPRAQVNPGDPDDFLYVCDQAGHFASLQAQTGVQRFATIEIGVGAVATPSFSYTVAFDNASALVPDVPTVFVASSNGTLTGIHARGNTNIAGRYRVWGYRTDGDEQFAGIATGGWRAGEQHSWMYTGDSSGFIYAFNSNNDTNANPITPGVTPGQELLVENDPDADDLNDIIDPDKLALLTPEAFDRLREIADTAGVTLADITPTITPGDPLYGVASRRHFEFGETMYLLVWDMPELTGNLANYFVEIELSSGGRTTQRRQIPVRPYGNTSGQPRYALVGLPIMTTGAGGLVPGKGLMLVRAVAPGQRGVQSTEVHLPKPPTLPADPTYDYYLANPLAVSFRDNAGGLSNSLGVDSGAGPGSGWEIPTIDTDPHFFNYNANGSLSTDQNPGVPRPTEPYGYVGPELTTKGDPVAHGSVGVQQALVFDRSLMRLLLGRGLAKVRVGPRDVVWQLDGTPTGGVYKPLAANAVNYPGFEDLPLLQPNSSLDYPDVGRESISVSKTAAGAVENPLFSLGVELAAPTFLDPDYINYRGYNGGNGYDAQLLRTLIPTTFDLSMNVPRFQPPGRAGYYGSQLVYVDTQVAGEQDVLGESYRTFGLGLTVAVDERMNVQTPTVDLGSLPSGGAYNGGAGFGPINPWDPNSAFGPWNAGFDNLFQPFVLVNEGNVNLLDLRMAKYFTDANGLRPVELYSNGQHELAWLDSRYHLHSSLDLRYSASLRVGGGPGFDPQGRNILQKSRPNDPVGTRFNVNPRSRPNAFLRTTGGYLFDPIAIPPGDAKVGASAPIGTPSGTYLRKIFPFENGNTVNDVAIDAPTLGLDEAFTDPGMDLKFIVRETRLTNAPTQKSAPMVESLLNGAETFAWTNSQPTGLRDGLGNIFVAFSSNRLDPGNVAGWGAKPRIEADATRQDGWRIYLGSLRSDFGSIPTDTQSPMADFNGWMPNTNQRWFRQAAGPLPAEPPANLFDVDTANGETLDPDSVRFGSPSFPSHGASNPLDPPLAAGKPWSNERYMAWIGEATKRDAAGSNVGLSQVMLALVESAADASVSVGPTQVAPFDPTSKKSRPSILQSPDSNVGGRTNVTVFTTSTSGALGQLNWYLYNSNQGWTGSGSTRLGTAFETVGAPSTTMRRYRNGGRGRIDVTFGGKVRGRGFAEVFLARLDAPNGQPRGGRGGLVAFATRTDELTVDTTSGVYWAPGVQWRTQGGDVDPNGGNFINLYTLDAAGQYVSIWDGKPETYLYDESARTVSFSTTLGGKAYIDAETGSVRLSGGVTTRDMRVFARYTPVVMRIAGGTGNNYRQASHVFDDRFIGVQNFPGNQQRSLLGDLSYWGDQNNVRPAPNALLRFDRTVVAYTRTSGDGASASRPYYQTFRFGLRLPTAIALLANGAPNLFQVLDWAGTPLAERFYQLDPGSGRVFVMSGAEDEFIRVRYRGVDDAGNVINQPYDVVLRAGLLAELDEQAVPIEQVGNEGGLSLALDPMNSSFNADSVRRPGLVWMFWSSSRGGVPDVFMQTIAPRFTPRAPTP